MIAFGKVCLCDSGGQVKQNDAFLLLLSWEGLSVESVRGAGLFEFVVEERFEEVNYYWDVDGDSDCVYPDLIIE
jgi:hypothetical protein